MIVGARQPAERFTATRYDRQVREAALAVMSSSKYTALRQLNCTVADGVLEISGTVPSFYLKQLAQAAMMQLDGVGVVRNLVHVTGESPVVVANSCV